MNAAPGTRVRRTILLVAPVAIVVTMLALFTLFGDWFGPRLGYLASFLIYWAGWCIAFSIRILGREKLGRLFAPSASPFGHPAWLGLSILLLPLLLSYGYAFP